LQLIFGSIIKICTFAELNYNHLIIRIMAHVISEDCIACGTCIDECPVEAISEGDIYKIDPDVCTDCGTCADVCPVEAIHPA
jgi:ferredoxin